MRKPDDGRKREEAQGPKARLEALEAVCSAIAHPARRQILLAVHFRGSMTAGQIAGRFAHAWPTTTRHLRVLEDATLLAHEKVGRARIYRVRRDRLAILEDWLAWFDRDPALPVATDSTTAPPSRTRHSGR